MVLEFLSYAGSLMGCADADRLPWTAVRRTTVLGLLIGGMLRALRWSKELLEAQVQTRTQAAEGRADVVNVAGAVVDGEQRGKD